MTLTDEDKQWVSAQFTAIIERIEGRFAAMSADMGRQFTASGEHVHERTHDIETRLLRAFADYNTNANIRFRKLEADASNLDTSSTLSMGELERQVAELHAKINLLESGLSA